MEFHYSPTPEKFLRKDDFEKIIFACKTIGDCIYDTPQSGITINGIDYVPADLMEDPEAIYESFKTIESYFGFDKKDVGSQ